MFIRMRDLALAQDAALNGRVVGGVQAQDRPGDGVGGRSGESRTGQEGLFK